MVNQSFTKQLTRLDTSLRLRLDRALKRFIIERRDRRGLPRQILVIETPMGDFCYPSHNHLDKLYSMDSWANKNLIKDIDAHNEGLDDEADKANHYLSERMSKLITRSKYF